MGTRAHCDRFDDRFHPANILFSQLFWSEPQIYTIEKESVLQISIKSRTYSRIVEMSGASPPPPAAPGSNLSYEEIKQQSQQKEALRVSQLYGSGAGAAKSLTMAGKKKQGNTFVSEGIIHFPFDPEVDLENAKIKVFNCREIHKGEGRAAFGGGVRLFEQAVTSASASFNEVLSALSVCLKLKLEPTELAALLAEFRCVETFKRKGRVNSRVVIKPFVTGLIRLAETLREHYRQKHKKECEDFHEKHVQVKKNI